MTSLPVSATPVSYDKYSWPQSQSPASWRDLQEGWAWCPWPRCWSPASPPTPLSLSRGERVTRIECLGRSWHPTHVETWLKQRSSTLSVQVNMMSQALTKSQKSTTCVNCGGKDVADIYLCLKFMLVVRLPCQYWDGWPELQSGHRPRLLWLWSQFSHWPRQLCLSTQTRLWWVPGAASAPRQLHLRHVLCQC